MTEHGEVEEVRPDTSESAYLVTQADGDGPLHASCVAVVVVMGLVATLLVAVVAIVLGIGDRS